MRTVLALAVLLMCAWAAAAETQHATRKLAIICTKFADRSAGLTKVCYYDCGGTEAATTVKVYDECPSWKPRWRFSRNTQFGPSGIPH